VGAFTDTIGGDAPLILHWDGKRWSHSYGTPRDRGILYSVAVAGKEVWAVGGTDSDFSSPAIILRLAAGHWHSVPSPAKTSLTGLAMTGNSTGWAAGPAEGQAKGVLLHWDGKAWVSASAALSAGHYLSALSAGSGRQVWGVGNIDPSIASFSMFWTGKAWRTAPVQWRSSHRTRISQASPLSRAEVPGHSVTSAYPCPGIKQPFFTGPARPGPWPGS
jgi:hypothetical protein